MKDVYVTEDGLEITKEQFLEFTNINGYNLENRIAKEQQRLREEFLKSGKSEEEFYKDEMLKYSRQISELIIKDYGEILGEDTRTKIERFNLTNESIVFLDKKDFPEVSVDGKKPSAFARKSDGKVYFPLYDKSIDIVTFIRKREQELVHEIFHIVTKNKAEKEELVHNGIKVGEYKPGSLFEEALVEKSARDFATRHSLVYHPMAQYMPYVNSLEVFMKKYNIQQNHEIFNRNYQEIISIATPEEQRQYYTFEYNHNLRRLSKNITNSSSRSYVQGASQFEQQNELRKPKTRVRTMNNNIQNTRTGFVNVLLITAIILIMSIIFILIYKK